jgi:tetratricopeptide (TPR) repeat protein
MASSARMDELRKKFDENPRRYFAPLANEYRKVGDLEQAIFICQEYLPQQPGHMSGHIVYGQALFESGRQDEARAVFETALALDPENLIALRHLGDIARSSGDPEGARQWYQRVLEADPRNDEIAALLDSLSPPPVAAAPTFSEAPTVEIPAARLEESGSDTVADTVLASAIEKTPDAEPWVGAETADEDEVALDTEPELAPDTALGADTDAAAGSAQTPATEQTVYEQALDLELTIPGASAPPAAPSLDFIADEPPAAPPTESGPSIADDGLLDLPDFGLPPSPPAAPAGELPLSDPFGGVLGTPAEAALESERLVVEELSEPADDGAQPVPEAFVTETMAELYLRQGHVSEALDLYDRLMAQRPYDDALAARAAAARQQALGGPTIREFLRSIFHGSAAAVSDPAAVLPESAAAAAPTAVADSDQAMASALARGFGPLPE